MIIRKYEYLPEEAKEIRTQVFMKEQGFKDEFDEVDNMAIHLVLFDEDEKALGTCRVYFNEDKSCYSIGRVAVLKSCRGKNLGAELIKGAEEAVKAQGGRKIELSGQVRAAGFYEKLGYNRRGEIYLDEGCPHISMEKIL